MGEFSRRLLAERHILVREVLPETTTAGAVVVDLEDREAAKVVVVADQWAVLLPGTGDEARDLITVVVEVEVASGVDEDVTSGPQRTQLEGCFAVHVREMCKVAPCSRYHAHENALPLKPDFQATTGTKPHRMCMTETSV
jgi:hypothetical protein